MKSVHRVPKYSKCHTKATQISNQLTKRYLQEEDMLSDLYSDSDEYGSESGSDEYYEEDEFSKDDENISEGSCSYEDDSDPGSSSSYSESGDDDNSKVRFFDP